MSPKKKEITLDHVEKLSHGKRSGLNIGSRGVGHHLHAFEREMYERALKKGFLEVTVRSRKNLTNVWSKACLATGWNQVVLIKDADGVKVRVLVDEKVCFEGSLHEAKKVAKEYGLINLQK